MEELNNYDIPRIIEVYKYRVRNGELNKRRSSTPPLPES